MTYQNSRFKNEYLTNYCSKEAKVLVIIATHAKSCSLFITNGGANLIIFPWVGFASKPLSLRAKQIFQAVSLSSVSLIKIAFNKPLPLTPFTIVDWSTYFCISSLNK